VNAVAPVFHPLVFSIRILDASLLFGGYYGLSWRVADQGIRLLCTPTIFAPVLDSQSQLGPYLSNESSPSAFGVSSFGRSPGLESFLRDPKTTRARVKRYSLFTTIQLMQYAYVSNKQQTPGMFWPPKYRPSSGARVEERLPSPRNVLVTGASTVVI
jgi:hypothetical protein